jgi:hypothetical protein
MEKFEQWIQKELGWAGSWCASGRELKEFKQANQAGKSAARKVDDNRISAPKNLLRAENGSGPSQQFEKNETVGNFISGCSIIESYF